MSQSGVMRLGGLTNHPILSLPSSTLQEHAVRVPAVNTQLQICEISVLTLEWWGKIVVYSILVQTKFIWVRKDFMLVWTNFIWYLKVLF